MKPRINNRHAPGFVSYLLVLTTATLLSLLSIYAYRRAMTAHKIETQVQLRVDYSEKEEAVLRSIVSIVPNQAIRAMTPNSAVAGVAAQASWAGIFDQALAMGNSRTSIPAALETRMGMLPTVRRSNTGDSPIALTAAAVFSAIRPLTSQNPALVSPGSAVGAGTPLGAGFPPVLNYIPGVSGERDSINDGLYPIISNTKRYGSVAEGNVGLLPGSDPGIAGTRPGYDFNSLNLVRYPQINFNYCKPGELFIAKRNWWGFSLNVGNQDAAATRLAQSGRDFVLSIYEIPSQLAISSAAATLLGSTTGAKGGDWAQGRVVIDGGISTGRATLGVPKNAATATSLTSLAARGGMSIADGAVVGGATMTATAMGDRENFQNSRGGVALQNQTTMGDFYPVSLSSDSGRCAFVPISVGDTFYDRFTQPDFLFDKYNPNPGAASLSSTSWNDYSVGARQCAMQLDVTDVVSSIAPLNPDITGWTFSYLVGGMRVAVPVVCNEFDDPPGYIRIRNDGGNYDFGPTPVKVAYGSSSGNFVPFTVSGNYVFRESNLPAGRQLEADGRARYGYIESAFEPIPHTPGSPGIIRVYPKRFPRMLAALGADPTTINHSLVVNVNYGPSGIGGVTTPLDPIGNSRDRLNTGEIKDRYTLLMSECEDLTSFPRGFSLVTNLNFRLSDAFNSVSYRPANIPPNLTPSPNAANPAGLLFPATSIFAPSSRYGNTGIEVSRLTFGGQRNSLRRDEGGDAEGDRVNPMVSQQANDARLAADRLTLNLSQMRNPVQIPPVTMMNWLIVLEERRREYVGR